MENIRLFMRLSQDENAENVMTAIGWFGFISKII
jgi:hypothetical protein